MAMHDTDIDSFLKEKHNDLIKPIFNEYVQIMKREDMPDDHRLAESVYTLNRFVGAIKSFTELAKLKLTENMQKDGVLSYKTKDLTVSLVSPVPSCIISDPDIISRQHPELMSPSKTDKTEIAKRLRKGEEINGAYLNNGGPPTLRITPVSKNANPYAGENSHEQ